MLIITMVIAALTLIERKFLALNQRRVGPYYVGYRGRLQYIADALKLFIKGVVVYDESNKFWFIAVPSFAGLICYFFWVNSVWCPSVSIVDIEYNLVYASLLSVSFGFCIILLGYFSGNKYTRLASIRAALSMLNLELFLGLMILTCVTVTESFCFSVFVLYQENYWLIFTFFGLSGIICIIFLLEVGRTPFDLAEAESELVVGYSTEIGGFTFGIFYLGEYFHLFFFSAVISILFFGGWEFPNFIFNYLNIDELLSNLHFILVNYLIDFELEEFFDLCVDFIINIIFIIIDEVNDEINNNFIFTAIYDVCWFFEDLIDDIVEQVEIMLVLILYSLDINLGYLFDLVVYTIEDLYEFIIEDLDIEEYFDIFLDYLYNLPYVGKCIYYFIEFLDELCHPFSFFYYAAELLKCIMLVLIYNFFDTLQSIDFIDFLFYYLEDFFFYITYNIGYYTDIILDIILDAICDNFIVNNITLFIDDSMEYIIEKINYQVEIIVYSFLFVLDDFFELMDDLADEINNFIEVMWEIYEDASLSDLTWVDIVEVFSNSEEDFIEYYLWIYEFMDECLYNIITICEDIISSIFFDYIVASLYEFVEDILLTINSDTLFDLFDEIVDEIEQLYYTLSDDFEDLIALIEYVTEITEDIIFFIDNIGFLYIEFIESLGIEFIEFMELI